jgi:hypothetical protein
LSNIRIFEDKSADSDSYGLKSSRFDIKYSNIRVWPSQNAIHWEHVREIEKQNGNTNPKMVRLRTLKPPSKLDPAARYHSFVIETRDPVAANKWLKVGIYYTPPREATHPAVPAHGMLQMPEMGTLRISLQALGKGEMRKMWQ